MDFFKINDKCRLCSSTKLKKIVSIGRQPISSIFHNSKRYNEERQSRWQFSPTKKKNR